MRSLPRDAFQQRHVFYVVAIMIKAIDELPAEALLVNIVRDRDGLFQRSLTVQVNSRLNSSSHHNGSYIYAFGVIIETKINPGESVGSKLVVPARLVHVRTIRP